MLMKETFIKQLETYSNGIIAFSVLQGLAYSFYFGSNEMFNCHVKASHLLAEFLIILFVIITILAIIAIKYLGARKIELAPEYAKMIRTITIGKMVIVSIFGFFPAFLTFFYGASAEVPKSCQTLIF